MAAHDPPGIFRASLFHVAKKQKEEKSKLRTLQNLLDPTVGGFRIMNSMKNWVVINPEYIHDDWLDDIDV